MKWSREEIEQLFPILKQVLLDLEPLEGKSILVLCSAAGDVAFLLAERMKHGLVIGLELSDEMLEAAQRTAKEKGLETLSNFGRRRKSAYPCLMRRSTLWSVSSSSFRRLYPLR